MSRILVDIHVIQTVPPSNINRDDADAPKTAVYGGRRRARVSSQAWKRATRDAFSQILDPNELGVRTKQVVELVAKEIAQQDNKLTDESISLAASVLGAAGIKIASSKKKDAVEEANYLVFLSRRQIIGLAELAVEAANNSVDGKVTIDKKLARARANQQHSVDVSLFGRMVADAADLNVDAAVQVAHALSVHAVDNEYDYYTAVDDYKNADAEADAGAGMIGTIEFNSSTLYRYATVDVNRLNENLGDPLATQRAIEAFTQAFITSMPTGKQNTFANRTLPDAVLIIVRNTQSINLVGAFEQAVEDNADGGRVITAIEHLAQHARELHEAYNEQPVAAWTFGIGEKRIAPLVALAQPTTFEPAVAAVGEIVSKRLTEQQ